MLISYLYDEGSRICGSALTIRRYATRFAETSAELRQLAESLAGDDSLGDWVHAIQSRPELWRNSEVEDQELLSAILDVQAADALVAAAADLVHDMHAHADAFGVYAATGVSCDPLDRLARFEHLVEATARELGIVTDDGVADVAPHRWAKIHSLLAAEVEAMDALYLHAD